MYVSLDWDENVKNFGRIKNFNVNSYGPYKIYFKDIEC